jgi:molecular chaperone GrpE (heat shock protein)
MYWDGNTQSVRKIPVRVVKEDGIPGTSAEQPININEYDKPSVPVSDEITAPAGQAFDWESLALRLQAEMDNFRKRQVRRSDEAIVAERERLLRLVLPVVDNLARALSHDGYGDKSLRQGVELTYRELLRLLEGEGVTPIQAMGRPFSPELHEAVATKATDATAGTIVAELEKGYVMREKLLRPSRVVVAV